jgi:ligand-binding SRPBCC domain-containing protein
LSEFEFIARSYFDISPEKLFHWHETLGFDVLLQVDPNIKILKKPNSLAVGETAEFKIPLFPGIYKHWIAKHTAYQPPFRFEDTQIKGPFLSFVHSHEFQNWETGTMLTDRIQIRFLPLPFSGIVLGILLKKQFRERHKATGLSLGIAWKEELFQLRKI